MASYCLSLCSGSYFMLASPTVLTRVHLLHFCSVHSNILQSDWYLEIPSQGQTGCAQFPRPSLALSEEVRQGQKVTISQSRVPILLYGSTDFASYFVTKVSCTCSLPYLMLIRALYFHLGYRLADLYDLGQ